MFDKLFKNTLFTVVFQLTAMLEEDIFIFMALYNLIVKNADTKIYLLFLFTVFTNMLMRKCDSKWSTLLQLCLH